MSNLDSIVLVDAHVHIQNCFGLPQYFRCAYDNFKKEADNLGGNFTAVLLLSEVAGTDYFSILEEACADEVVFQDELFGSWTLKKTGESGSLEARSDNGESLIIIAGRQIVTNERLEVLALLTKTMFVDGKSLTHTVESIKAAGAIPVLPWGVGKWLGNRGKLVEDFLNSDHANGVFLGDNGGRPIFWRKPVHFKQANAVGIPILPGSDALPLASEVGRTGSFGFYVTKKLSRDQPVAELRVCLRERCASIKPFGKLRRPLRFLEDQIQIRLK